MCREPSSGEYDPDRIRLKDLRPLDDAAQAGAGRALGLGLGGAGAGPEAWQLQGQESSTEWSDSVLLRAFIARFGATRDTTTAGPLDLDGGEMGDFQPSFQPATSRAPSPPPASAAPTATGEERIFYPVAILFFVAAVNFPLFLRSTRGPVCVNLR